MFLLLATTSLLLLANAGVRGGTGSPVVATTGSGKLEGVVHVSRAGYSYYAFAGVPYAKPPVGELRFMPPVPAEPWTGAREAKRPGPLCPQVNIFTNARSPTGSEDCLYLSVYTKKLDGQAPVAVHFHGGAWLLGDGPATMGPQFLMDKDIVVVDVNYRLGILGFLSFEDSDLPGNMGLKDQAMALRWVQENIRHFGGDPERVTLMGECTGGVAVYHHLISPLSAGLFKQAIAESGSSFAGTGVMPRGLARERAARLADLMGCGSSGGTGGSSSTATLDIVSCLRTKDAMELTTRILDFLEWGFDPVLKFGAVFEADSPGAFLTGPRSSWVPPRVPLLTGTASGEGLLRTMSFTRNFDFKVLKGDGFEKLMPMSLLVKDTSTKPNEIISKIREFYLPGDDISMRDFQNLTYMYGDIWYSFAVIEGAKFSQGDVYLYFFDYVGDYTQAQFFGDKTKAKGAFHGDEALYLWQNARVPSLKGRDYKLSRDLVRMWTNFIITGNPTPNNELGFTWTTYSPGENYLDIRRSGIRMKKRLLNERYNFLKSLDFQDKLR